MAITTFQAGLTSVGHFDFVDSEAANLRGGEVVVFDSIHSSLEDRSAADVYIGPDGYRTVLRLATTIDEGPFFLADINSSSSFPSPGFELTSLFAQNQSFSRNLDSSGKVAVYGTEGLYSISSDSVDTDFINSSTVVNTKLYVNSSGKLTTEESASGQQVGYFIEFRVGTTLRSFSKPIQQLGAHNTGNTIIVYKSSR